jgi:hypothetical protein
LVESLQGDEESLTEYAMRLNQKAKEIGIAMRLFDLDNNSDYHVIIACMSVWILRVFVNDRLNICLTEYKLRPIMMIEIFGSYEFEDWYGKLEDPQRLAVTRYIDLLELQGLTLGHPYSSAIKGSKYALRELRVRTAGYAIRVFYAFDPKRNAVILLGGDKLGDRRFYDVMVPKAEKIFVDYLKKLEESSHGT